MKKLFAKTKHMNKPNAIRVALFSEKADKFTGWVAQCLDFDLVAQGATMADAQKSFQRTLVGHVALSLSRGKNPFYGMSSDLPTKTSKSAKIDLGKLRIKYSQLENLRTVAVVK